MNNRDYMNGIKMILEKYPTKPKALQYMYRLMKAKSVEEFEESAERELTKEEIDEAIKFFGIYHVTSGLNGRDSLVRIAINKLRGPIGKKNPKPLLSKESEENDLSPIEKKRVLLKRINEMKTKKNN